MTMYELIKDIASNSIICVSIKKGNLRISFPFAPDNTDYQNFKKEINEETAQLQDADGNTMTSSEAKAFVATLS